MMKTHIKKIVAAFSVMLVLIVSIVPIFAGVVVPTPTYVVDADLSQVEFIAGDPFILDGAIAVRNFGTVLFLGDLNLSNYTQIEIQYCSDASALSGDAGSAFCVTKNITPVWNLKDSQILTFGSMSNAQGPWNEDIRTATIDLTGIDYDGDTYLAIFMPDGNGVNIVSMTFTVQAYTQSELNSILKEYISPSAGIFEDAQVSANVDYTLSLVDEGGSYNSYTQTYTFSPDPLKNGVSFKSWYQSTKNSLFGNLTTADEGYFNSINLTVTLSVPVNIYAMKLMMTHYGTYMDLSLGVSLIDTDGNARDVILSDVGDYFEVDSKPFEGLSDNFSVSQIKLSIYGAGLRFDELFLTRGLSLWINSEILEQYAEAFNNGYKSGAEYQERIQDVLLEQEHQNGFEAGYDEGYRDGESDAYSDIDDIIIDEFQKGVNTGHEIGYDEGYFAGYEAGGGNKENFNLNSLIYSVFDAPVRAVVNFLNFEVLGFNLANIFTGIFTFLLLGLIVFIVLKILL